MERQEYKRILEDKLLLISEKTNNLDLDLEVQIRVAASIQALVYALINLEEARFR